MLKRALTAYPAFSKCSGGALPVSRALSDQLKSSDWERIAQIQNVGACLIEKVGQLFRDMH